MIYVNIYQPHPEAVLWYVPFCVHPGGGKRNVDVISERTLGISTHLPGAARCLPLTSLFHNSEDSRVRAGAGLIHSLAQPLHCMGGPIYTAIDLWPFGVMFKEAE